LLGDDFEIALDGVGALLDAILQIDRGLKDAPPPLESVRRTTKPSLALVKGLDPTVVSPGAIWNQ
jgi:hypothetical protein